MCFLVINVEAVKVNFYV